MTLVKIKCPKCKKEVEARIKKPQYFQASIARVVCNCGEISKHKVQKVEGRQVWIEAIKA